MSISQNYPIVSPSLNLDFANTKKLDPRVTFARASTATYYDGKTSSKAEENLLRYSQEFDNAVWDKVNTTLTANTTVAPDGTTTADTLTATVATSFFILGQNSAFGVNTTSIYAQNGTADFFQLTYNGDTTSYANFNLSTGVVGTSGGTVTHSITNVGGGWYRLVVVNSSTAVTGITWGIVGSASAIRRQSFTAVGTETVIVWGAQLEQRSTVTAYTPTTTQPITRYQPTLLTAPANVARFEHNPVTGESLGLEVEELRTNLFFRSEEFDNAYWTKTNVTVGVNQVVAPDGTLTADKFIATAVSGNHTIATFATLTANPFTASIYAKAREDAILMIYYQLFGTARAEFNLTTGAVLTAGTNVLSAVTQPVGNGWYRCSLTFTGIASLAAIGFSGLKASGATSYVGDGYSGIYIWGAQLE